MDINIINGKDGCRAMFWFRGRTYSFEGKTAREARKKAEACIATLKGGSLF